MRRKLKNKYFILRHGQSTHQTKKPRIVYFWPEDRPPASLTRKGYNQIKKAAQNLKKKKIDLIFSSDVLRTRQTAEIVAKELDIKVITDKRLRDKNWGIFQGKPKRKVWDYYHHNLKEAFKKAPPKGESWRDVKNRIIDFIKDIEKKYTRKNILIVSHGDPLWLLEGWMRGLSQNQLLAQKLTDGTIKTGELRQLNKL